jgi:hypothetical protein
MPIQNYQLLMSFSKINTFASRAKNGWQGANLVEL